MSFYVQVARMLCLCTKESSAGAVAAQRPCTQCCLLETPRSQAVSCYGLQVLPVECMSRVQKDQLTQRLISGLNWLAARAGPTTTDMTLEITTCKAIPGSRCSNPLIKAFANGRSLKNLKCLTTRFFNPINGSQALELFLEWLLEQIPGLVTLSLYQDANLRFATMKLDHLKHLELQGFKSVNVGAHILTQLPALETLCIDGFHGCTVINEVDVSESCHLRQLAFKNILMHRLIRRLSCHLSCRMNFLCHDFESLWSSNMMAILRSAEHIGLYCGDSFPSQAALGIFGYLPCVQVLTMSGQVIEDIVLLARCMPAGGLPVKNLRVLAMHAVKLKCYIPAGFPNLEELVVIAKQDLLLGFSNQEATFSTLKTFYAFGDPLKTHECDLLVRSLPLLVERSICMDAVEALMHSRKFSSGSKCLYLRPLKAEQLPIGALYKRASQLARQCRCGACFTCLQAAGCT